MKFIVNKMVQQTINNSRLVLVFFVILSVISASAFALRDDDVEAACEGKWGKSVVINGQEIICVKGSEPEPGPSTSGGGSTGHGPGGAGDTDDGGPGGGGVGLSKGTPQQCADKVDDCIDAHIGRPNSDGDIARLRNKTGKKCFTKDECALALTHYEYRHGGVSTMNYCKHCLTTNDSKKFTCNTDASAEAKRHCRDALTTMLEEIARRNIVDDWRDKFKDFGSGLGDDVHKDDIKDNF